MIELTEKVKKRFEIQLNKIYVGNAQIKKKQPVLNQIHYTEDGHIEITNSHVGVRLSNVHEKPDSDQKFPKMSHIFQLPDELNSIDFKLKDLKKLEDHLKVIYRKKIKTAQITINKSGIHIKDRTSDEKPKVFVESEINFNTNEEFTFGIQPRYLHDALMFFRLIGANDIALYVDGPLRPIHITSGNLHYIIMQVRMGD